MASYIKGFFRSLIGRDSSSGKDSFKKEKQKISLSGRSKKENHNKQLKKDGKKKIEEKIKNQRDLEKIMGKEMKIDKELSKEFDEKVKDSESKNKKEEVKRLKKDGKKKVEEKIRNQRDLEKIMGKEMKIDKELSKEFDEKVKDSESKNKKEEIRELSKSNISKKIEKKDIRGNQLRFKTGIKGFDNLFGDSGGMVKGSSILIEGGPGSGKTLFCLATISNLCEEGKKCLYMSFEEPEERLIEHMENLGWNPREFIKKGLLRIKRFNAIDVSRSIEALLSAAKKELLIEVDPVLFPEDFNPDLIAIDSLTSISSAFSGERSRFRVYMEQLFRYLEANKITNFLIREVSAPSHVGTTFKEQGEAVSFLSDGIIVLYNVIYDNGQREFAIEILKMRGTDFKKRIVKMEIINNKGIVIHPEKILKKSKEKSFSLT
jgi:KaiC/GvpD/RAD55 family RecA-like ATPase